MGFNKKTWKDRMAEFAGRRTLTKVSGSAEDTLVVDVARNEGEVFQAGDAYSAANMNDLEQRISDAIGTGDIPEDLGSDIISAINGLKANMGTQVTFSVSGTTLTITPK